MAIPVLHRVLLTGALTMLPLAFTAAAFTESAAAASPPAAAANAAQAPAHPAQAHTVVVDAHCQDAAHKAVDCAKMKCTDHAGKPVAACAAGHAAPAAHTGSGSVH